MALGLRATPPHMVAFFPQAVEDDLLRKELNFQGRQEEDITQTRFRWSTGVGNIFQK